MADLHGSDSPVRYINQMATERDFVSLKVDIDHPDTELPLVMAMFNDPSTSKLIDEFFFEVHFR